MKFAIPRSSSPSPERVRVHVGKSRPGFVIRAEDLDSSDDERIEFRDFAFEGLSSEDESEDEVVRKSSGIQNSRYSGRSMAEEQVIHDALQGIRMRVSYKDPFEQWHKEASLKARANAQQLYQERQRQLEADYLRALNEQVRDRYMRHQQQMEEVRQLFSGMTVNRGQEMTRLQSEFQKRDRALWNSVQQAIEDEERNIAAVKAEEERKAKEEQERKQREEKARLDAIAKKEQHEKEEMLKKELEAKKALKEAEQQKEKELKVQKEAEEQRKQAERLESVGVKPALDEWNEGRNLLTRLKREVHHAIKADREMKNLRNKLRRLITPKIGQLTNEAQHIERVTKELQSILRPASPHPPLIYTALLSAMAKAFLLQAETEVTAKPDTAMPLAKVLVTLLLSLPDFAQILYARLIQRLGFWAVPFAAPIPPNATKEEKDAIHGLRREDTDSERRLVRIGGIMTLLFCVMHTPHPEPLPEYYTLGRYWTYVARLLSSKELCGSNASLEILRVALAVAGDKALRVWGKQWVKVLHMIDKRMDESCPVIVGEAGVEGTARRVRLKVEIMKLFIQSQAVEPTFFN